MITKETTYNKALQIKKEILKKKLAQREILISMAYSKNKELQAIDNRLASLGANLAITAISGDAEKLERLKLNSIELAERKNVILKENMVEDVAYDCPLCSDTGYVNGKICECVKAIANKIAINDFNERMPIDECTFENFDLDYYKDDNNYLRRMTSILKLCKNYVSSFNPNTSENLLFLGGPGLGKTHLTLAIVSGVIKKGYLPVYGPAENLFSVIEKEKFQGENTGSYEYMQSCDLLVIDDLGTEMVTSFTKSVLYNLINTRILSKKPTIINTNLSLKEIEELYSPRITSRLIGNYNANMFLGNDIRQQKILRK